MKLMKLNKKYKFQLSFTSPANYFWVFIFFINGPLSTTLICSNLACGRHQGKRWRLRAFCKFGAAHPETARPPQTLPSASCVQFSQCSSNVQFTSKRFHLPVAHSESPHAQPDQFASMQRSVVLKCSLEKFYWVEHHFGDSPNVLSIWSISLVSPNGENIWSSSFVSPDFLYIWSISKGTSFGDTPGWSILLETLQTFSPNFPSNRLRSLQMSVRRMGQVNNNFLCKN